MKKLSITALKKKHPKLHLYYSDNGRWILYKKRPPINTYVGEKEHDACILLTSDQLYEESGYTPAIVQWLCDAVGITTESA